MQDWEFTARYDADKKSTLVGYLLWFFLGIFAVHLFYLGRVREGFALLACEALCVASAFMGVEVAMVDIPLLGLRYPKLQVDSNLFFGIFVITLATVLLWTLWHAISMPGMVRKQNNKLINQMKTQQQENPNAQV